MMTELNAIFAVAEKYYDTKMILETLDLANEIYQSAMSFDVFFFTKKSRAKVSQILISITTVFFVSK